MKRYLLITILFPSYLAFSQTPIATVDVQRGKQQYEKEVVYFYEQNWKAFREEALKAGQISSYKLIKTLPDSTGYFNIILITEFPDSARFKNREDIFRPIMKRLSPNGPKMLNDVKRSEMLKAVSSYEGLVIVHEKK